MAQQNTVTKIYRLETIGYNDIHKQFQQLSDDLLKIKKLIIDLQGKSVGLKGDDLAKVNTQIREAVQLHDQLETQIDQTNKQVDNSVSKYAQLNNAYKQAKQNAQDLAAEYGVESEQAKAAAASAGELKKQLLDINNLVKTGGKQPAPVIPISTAPSQTQNVQVLTNTQDLENQKQLLQDVGGEVVEVKTKYEQYTGSLRDNITAQIENNSQLSKNRDSQKAIQAVINAQGSATEQQINQLAALRQQELILIETNKQLTVTVRNQTQEFIAGVGAVDEMQAQLNQLQQQYEKLTEEQRAAPFGQDLKKEIDDLLPKVKALEEEQGKFGRNVGNYQGSAKLIVDALKNVENEITNLQQKQQGLVNFSKSNPIGFKLSGGQENLNQVNGQLEGLQKQFTALNTITSNPQFLNIASKVGDNRQEIRFFTNQLSELRKEGLDTSDVFKQIEARLAELTKDTRETRESIKALSSETRSLDLVASGFRSLADGAQLFVGAQTLLGRSDAQVQKSLQTLLAVQNVATGARELANEATQKGTALNKAYNFVLTNTKNLFDANTTSASKWLSVLKLGIAGAIIGGIILLIQNLDKLDDKQQRLTEGLNELGNTTDLTKEKLKEYGDTLDKVSEGAIKTLDQQIKSFNDELGRSPSILDESTAAIQLNRQEVDRLTASLDNFQTVGKRSIRESLGNVIPFIGGGTVDKLKEAQKNLDELNKKQQQFLALQAETSIDAHQKADIESANRVADLQIDDNNRVLNDTKATEKQKIQAINSTFVQRKQIIQNNLDLELLANKNNLLKQNEARQKANVELVKNNRDLLDQVKKVREQADQNQTQNTFKNIDTLRDEQLAKEKTRLLELQKGHQLSIDEEIIYLTNIEKINLDALDAKIKFLTAQKKLNAEELKTLAEFRQQRVELELKTNDDIQKAREQQFQRQVELLKNQLEGDIAAVQEKADVIVNNPTISTGERAKAKFDADNQVLALQEQFNQKIDELEKQLNAQSIGNAKQGASQLVSLQQSIRRTKEEILKDQLAIANANLTDINNSADKLTAQFDANYNILRQKILENDKLTAKQRKEQLDKLELIYQHDLLASELARLTIRFQEIKKQYDKGLADEKAFLQAKADMEKAKADLDNSNRNLQQANIALPSSEETQNQLKDRLSKAFGFAEGSGEDQLLGNVIADSFNTAQLAMNAYFDAEEARIQQSLDFQLKRIEADKEQAQNRAQSQAEIDSIEKQAAAKTKAAQKQAGEELKKVKKSEAKIALATELANIAVAAAQNPLNGVTFGAAGAIMYGLLAALAAARYAINISAINREQFAYGGKPGSTKLNQRALSFITPKWYRPYAYNGRNGDVPLRGGKFGGQPHGKGGTPFYFKGNEYEGEIDELSVIRTKNAPKGKRFTVTGTQSQIASAINKVGGGHDFEPGATITEHKNVFTKTINKIFNRGGILREKKITEKENNYSETINKIFSERKDLVDSKAINEITSIAVARLAESNERKTSISRIIINKLVQEKIDLQNRQSNVSVTTDSYKKINEAVDSLKTTKERLDHTQKSNDTIDHHQETNETIDRVERTNKIVADSVTKNDSIDHLLKTNDTIEHYQTVIDNVVSENKDLVISKNNTELLTKVVNKITSSHTIVTAKTISLLSELVNEKIDNYHNTIYTVTGSPKQIVSVLDQPVKAKFALGGSIRQVPLQGGEFGGQPHHRGGTKFIFKDHEYEAEVDELAIIRRRNADRNKVYTVTGNQMQLASFANVIGGGVNFKPGATAKKFATGGVLGSSLQAPIYVPNVQSNNNSEALLAAIKDQSEILKIQNASNQQMIQATNARIDRLQVEQVTDSVTKAQKKLVKQNSVGTIS